MIFVFSFENRKIWREIDTHKQREKIEAGERKRARQKQRKAQTGLQNGRYSETRHTDRSMIVARQTDRHNHETSRQKENDSDKTDEDTEREGNTYTDGDKNRD